MDVYGFNYEIYMDLYGFIWIYMDLYRYVPGVRVTYKMYNVRNSRDQSAIAGPPGYRNHWRR